jgi:hypothetical protein
VEGIIIEIDKLTNSINDMGLIKEPLNIDLVVNSNANEQELLKIDLMIKQIKMRDKPLSQKRLKVKKVIA